ncbi:hypothetical protein SGLAM104S_02670 [Streptomyces glaucescens]
MVHDAGVRALERCRTGSPFSDSVRLSGGFGPGAGSDRGKRTGRGGRAGSTCHRAELAVGTGHLSGRAAQQAWWRPTTTPAEAEGQRLRAQPEPIPAMQSQSHQPQQHHIRRREHVVGADLCRIDQKRKEEQHRRDYAEHEGTPLTRVKPVCPATALAGLPEPLDRHPGSDCSCVGRSRVMQARWLDVRHVVPSVVPPRSCRPRPPRQTRTQRVRRVSSRRSCSTSRPSGCLRRRRCCRSRTSTAGRRHRARRCR